jgi:hypothetical protein
VRYSALGAVFEASLEDRNNSTLHDNG